MSNRVARFYRMNKVRDALKQKPHRFNELIPIVYGSDPPLAAKRTLQYDLQALTILELITLEAGFYHSNEGKQTYRNQAEYRAAIAHTKKLMLTDRYNQNFDQIVPNAIAGVLVRGMHPLVMQHLKTGYYFDIYQPLMRYKKLEEEYPSISQNRLIFGERLEKAPKNISSEYDTLKMEIANKIYDLVSKADNGVPLKGHCSSCPTRHVEIG